MIPVTSIRCCSGISFTFKSYRTETSGAAETGEASQMTTKHETHAKILIESPHNDCASEVAEQLNRETARHLVEV